MLSGTYSTIDIEEESACRTTKDYLITEIGLYQIHANILMNEIPFSESQIVSEPIDTSIFINDSETKPSISSSINTQNYLTTRYVGRAPLEWYSQGEYTAMGRQFILICRHGMCTPKYRYFGTEDAIYAVNRNVNEPIKLPDGGEE